MVVPFGKEWVLFYDFFPWTGLTGFFGFFIYNLPEESYKIQSPEARG